MKKEKTAKVKMPKKKKIVIIVSSVLTALIVLSIVYFFAVGGVLYHVALDRNFQFGSGGGAGAGDGPFHMETEWWNSFDKAESYITSNDGLKLTAYEFLQEEESHLWAINVHGYRANALSMSPFTRKYFESGYNVLTPDLRAHGKSEGSVIGMGWLDRLDMLLWIDTIVTRDPLAKIILHGISMGGATVMMTTGEVLPSNVKVAIEDCGYTTVYEQFDYVAKTMIGVPSALAMPEGEAMITIKTGRKIREESSIEQLKKSITPTLFIHGTADTFVPFFMLQKNYDAKSGEKKLLDIEGAGHARSETKNPELYWTTVFDYISRFIA